MKKFVRLENSRLDEQTEVMKKILEDKVCPFCLENLAKYHKKPVLLDGKYWIVTRNQWPYDGAKNHLLAIAKEHVEQFNKLSKEAGAELLELFQRMAKKLKINGGTVAMRFGTTKYASSVAHLHAHLIEPDVENKNHQGIKFPVSKSNKK